MEGISHMVTASLARHGFVTQIDHRRLQWSRWCRCESSRSVILAPNKPGLFALAEDESVQDAFNEKRLLTLFRIAETEDLGMALGSLFLPGAPEREHLTLKKCYLRFAVVEDADQRHASYVSLQEWMASPPSDLTVHNFAESPPLAPTGT